MDKLAIIVVCVSRALPLGLAQPANAIYCNYISS